jgi:hypothetical protein
MDIEKIAHLLASHVGDGMRLEAAAPGLESAPFAWVRADELTGLRFVVASDKGEISMPLDELETFIARARAEVRPENDFDLPLDES